MRKIIVFSIVFFLLGFFLAFNLEKIKEKNIYLKKRKVYWQNLKNLLEGKIKGFGGKTAVFIKDLETGWEIGFSEKEPFPAASLIKVPIMVSCFLAEKEGRLKFSETLELKNSDKVLGSGVLKSVPAGEEFTVDKLVELMIVVSDNTATNMLIEKLGYDYLNNSFKKMGLKNTKLVRKMMDFRYRKKGIDNFTTAEDIACILEKIYRKDIMNKKISQKCLELLLLQKYRDRIPAKLPQGTKVAHKTGLERKVCHDAGIVFGSKGDFIIVVLTKGVDSKRAKEFISEISFLVYNYYFIQNKT